MFPETELGKNESNYSAHVRLPNICHFANIIHSNQLITRISVGQFHFTTVTTMWFRSFWPFHFFSSSHFPPLTLRTLGPEAPSSGHPSAVNFGREAGSPTAPDKALLQLTWTVNDCSVTDRTAHPEPAEGDQLFSPFMIKCLSGRGNVPWGQSWWSLWLWWPQQHPLQGPNCSPKLCSVSYLVHPLESDSSVADQGLWLGTGQDVRCAYLKVTAKVNRKR